ncbi:MAG: glycosyltransferase family 9 protein [Gammaproteobacteria bacterium]|nr:glycosyltransferase family 9 protein [Gammaproteobacteria bacterium]
MAAAPRSICLLRLSALGDVTHVVPVVRTLQRCWPETRLTWIIGYPEHRLLEGMDGVEFLVYDKRSGVQGIRQLWRSLRSRRFDVLLHMQLALRTNILARGIRAERRIGYDRARSKEGHGLAVRERIPADGHHVLDVLGNFVRPLGLRQDRVEWRLPVPDEAYQWAEEQLPGKQPSLIISPCSSHALRNWSAERYAAVGDHAAASGWRVVLCGGRSALERCTANAIIENMKAPAIDLVGKDTLKQFIALLARADALLAPDSGPVHIANAVGTPVLGLYACTDPRRSGPYSDQRWTVDRYDEAARKFMQRPAAELRWGQKVEVPGAMELIQVDDVIGRFDALRSLHAAGEPEA